MEKVAKLFQAIISHIVQPVPCSLFFLYRKSKDPPGRSAYPNNKLETRRFRLAAVNDADR